MKEWYYASQQDYCLHVSNILCFRCLCCKELAVQVTIFSSSTTSFGVHLGSVSGLVRLFRCECLVFYCQKVGVGVEWVGECLVPRQSLLTDTVFPGVWNRGTRERF